MRITDNDAAQQFEHHRPRLLGAALRMLGSVPDAEDVVQEAWFRFTRSSPGEIDNVAAWLTTVVSRLCLDTMRTRARRAEDAMESHLEPVEEDSDPLQRALAIEGVGFALQVVLNQLTPEERVAFVLHDVFDIPFADIAEILRTSNVAARKLASRARQRVRGRDMTDAVDAATHPLVEAFLAAARGNDLAALIAIMHPEITLQVETGDTHTTRLFAGRDAVAERLTVFHQMATTTTSAPMVIRGAPGLISQRDGRVISLIRFETNEAVITSIEIESDPERLAAYPWSGPEHASWDTRI